MSARLQFVLSFLIVVFLAVGSASAQGRLPPGVGEKINAIMKGGGEASGYPVGYTKSNYLPEWCDYTWDGTSKVRPVIEDYFRYFGEGFMAMHHYCRGLYRAHEARENPRDRSRNLELYRRAIIEYGFVLKNTDDQYRLRSEVLVQTGLAHLSRGESMDAVRAFQTAIDLRPTYIPAYVALGNYFRRAGQASEARRVLESGIAAVPQSDLLRTKLRELGSQDTSSR